MSLDPASSFPPKSPACQLPLSPAHVAWYLREAGPLEEAQRKGSHIKGSKHPVSKSREGGFPTPKTILQHQLGILKFNSILTLSGNTIRFHRPRAQSCKTEIPAPTSATNGKSKLSPGLQMKGSSDRLLQFNYFARAAHKTQRNILFVRLLFFLATLHGLWESQFPNQGLNPGHGSESSEPSPLDPQGSP